MTALDKKNGADVRPITVGETMRRVISKCLCAKVKSDARRFFAPFQFGNACKAGTERVIHLLRTIYNKWIDADDFVILKVDLKKGF